MANIFVRKFSSYLSKCRIQTFYQLKANLASSARIHPGLRRAKFSEEKRILNTEWSDGVKTTFPLAWLKDNCQCPKCFLEPSQARILVMKNYDPDDRISNIKVDKTETTIHWEDGHVSTFKADWLWGHRLTPDGRAERRKWLPLKPKLWNRELMQENIPTDKYENIMKNDESLFRWICHMERDGLFLITDTPTDEGHAKDIADRVEFMRKTHYGTDFSVRSKGGPSNAAYTSVELGLHTDLSFYNYVPGIQLFHCVKQVKMKGGENQFADGFYAAEQIRRDHPEHFETLTTLPVTFSDIGTDLTSFDKMFTRPTVKLSISGEIEQISYSDQSRFSYQYLDPDEVATLYKALKLFSCTTHSKENRVELKLKEGEIICTHNFRVMHARSSFVITENSERHLEGCYIDWDEMHSRRRVLQEQHGFDPSEFYIQ